jgi:hypothetical protein
MMGVQPAIQEPQHALDPALFAEAPPSLKNAEDAQDTNFEIDTEVPEATKHQQDNSNLLEGIEIEHDSTPQEKLPSAEPAENIEATEENPTGTIDEDDINLVESTTTIPVKFEPSVERELPEPPTLLQSVSSLVSPPESTHTDHTDGETTPPSKKKRITPPATSTSSRRSSRTAKQTERFTPDSGPARRASTVSSTSNAIRASGSPVVSLGMDVKEGSPSLARKKEARLSSVSDFAGDDESLKLIRELQAADMGLRRRGKT